MSGGYTELDAGGANPQFLEAAAIAGVRYLASDSSQRAQNVEQFITQYEDGSPADRLLLPRWPTDIFFNVTNSIELEDEYNYLYNGRFVEGGQDPCEVPQALCSPRNYAEILFEADLAVRHTADVKKVASFFPSGKPRQIRRGGIHSSLTGLTPYSQNMRSC